MLADARFFLGGLDRSLQRLLGAPASDRHAWRRLQEQHLALLNKDDHLLRDLGLNRGEVLAAAFARRPVCRS